MLVGKAPHTSMRAHGIASFGFSDVGDDLGTFLQARAYHFKFGKVEGGCPSTTILILKARPMIRTKLLVFTSLLTVSVFAHAQEILPLDKITDQVGLDKTITALDAALFDAYNRCDLQKFGSLIDEDIEFYHDKAGNTFGRTALTEAIKNNICGKVTREIVPGTLQVFPMKGYGALEIGVHRFHHPGQEDTIGIGEANFIHLWQFKDGAWKVTRVISYDHHAAAK
jgi:Domain of unknown function (DUF4440)